MRYIEPLGDAQNALTNENLTQQEKFDAQLEVIQLSSDRLLDASGGYTFEGQAIGEGGDVLNGRYGLLGPISTFAVEETGGPAGITNDAGGSKPSLITMDPELAEGVRDLLYAEEGQVPLDVTMGDALKMEATEETLLEHLEKGGFTMYPLLGLGALAVLIGLFKWIQLSRYSSISRRRFAEMMDAIEEGNMDEARAIAEKVGGPIGDMLLAGIEHLNEPKELIEEVFYEKILSSRTNFMKLLPFIAVTASAAPLLGLLGTVTGMINTFKLITVFGTGDAQSLSGGISEALVTTEWGLIVAIPNLLLYAFLSRKAKGIAEDMDQLAIGFMNRLQESETHQRNGNGNGGGAAAEQDAREAKPAEAGGDRPTPKPTSDPAERSKVQAEMVDEAKDQARSRPRGDPERPNRMGPDAPEPPGSKK
jgi:biopolymer transport protein ExbB